MDRALENQNWIMLVCLLFCWTQMLFLGLYRTDEFPYEHRFAVWKREGSRACVVLLQKNDNNSELAPS